MFLMYALTACLQIRHSLVFDRKKKEPDNLVCTYMEITQNVEKLKNWSKTLPQ